MFPESASVFSPAADRRKQNRFISADADPEPVVVGRSPPTKAALILGGGARDLRPRILHYAPGSGESQPAKGPASGISVAYPTPATAAGPA